MKEEAARLSGAGKKPLLTGDVTKSIDIDREILDFLTTYVTKKYLEKNIHPLTLLTSIVTILRKPVAADILSFFIIHGAATVNVLREKFPGYSKVSIYRTLEFLELRGLVVETRHVRTEGRPAMVYALRGYTADDLVTAIERDRLARTPAYAEVNRIIQLLLDSYLPLITHGDTMGGRIYKAEVTPIVRKECRGLQYSDLLPLVENELRRSGYEVVL